MIPRKRDFDALVVGYPGHFDVPQARGFAGRKPLVFLPRVSLTHELVERRGRFRPRSIAARVVHATDVRALKLADVVVTDADATADYLTEAWQVDRDRMVTIFAGAEERVFCEQWSPVYPFGAFHVPQPGSGVWTVLEVAARVPELPLRIAGGELPDAPANVEWTDPTYERLGLAYAHAGVAIGSLEESMTIPDAVFHALATGTPLVTAATRAAREVLVDGESALLVPPGDPDAAAAALRRVSSDEQLRQALSEHGRRTYEERASERVLGAEWRALVDRQVGIV